MYWELVHWEKTKVWVLSFSLSSICVFPAMLAAMHQRCAWSWFWTYGIRPPSASNRIRSEVFFAIAGSGLDLDFVFAEKTLLVVCLAYIYAESNRSQIACVMLEPVRSGFGLKVCRQDWIQTQKYQSPHTFIMHINSYPHSQKGIYFLVQNYCGIIMSWRYCTKFEMDSASL